MSAGQTPQAPDPGDGGQTGARAKKSPSKAGKSRPAKFGRRSQSRRGGSRSKPIDLSAIPERPIALVGLMGVGKTTVGRRVAKRLGWEHFDSDHEIEAASGRTVSGYFRDHGEAAFRSGERRVIERLLREHSTMVLSTGGGAFIPEDTRKALLEHATVIFLHGDLDTLMKRVSRRDTRTRPLLAVPDPRAKMKELMEVRYPIYGEAHITVPIARGPHVRTVDRVLRALADHGKDDA